MATTPNPALVTQRAAQRLPRLALLLFCAAYVLPGLFGRDPWRNADITAFGYMASIAQGHSSWLAPSVGGLPADAALLPYWIGAAAIALLTPLVEPAIAARLPFALLLVVSLAMTWYSTYHLARTDAAQPLPFAFGGEADPVDYARAVADGAVLALIATLGLLQLGHETTPELAQLASVSIFLYAMAASPYRPRLAPLAVWGALPALAASGAPAIAVALAVAGLVISVRSSYQQVRRFSVHVGLAGMLAAATASMLGAWDYRIDLPASADDVRDTLRLFAWFTWPTLPLAAWTLWRWRLHWQKRHMAVPLACAAVAMVASILMGGVDRALMLALPPLAVLGAFALPTLQRSSGAAIDWFSVFFFSICALTIWVIYLAVQTGFPARPAANVQRLLPGLQVSFSWPELMLAIAGSVAWIALVFWRTGRHRHPLWKSMVLPAGGVALCWLLLMSIWLPMLDYARSERPLVQRVSRHLPKDRSCVAMPSQPLARIAAIEQLGGYRVDAATPLARTPCDFLLRQEPKDAVDIAPPGWRLLARVRRPTERLELTAIYAREPRR
ncbi:ArnT family glycosyltransferase [Piscinibacter sakaiensis]|uniref:ArnT family glycosyltransferase n=1 Tax=Piscinibacter sakaiensis TaxID=1547922 RepID=UPI003AAFCCCB